MWLKTKMRTFLIEESGQTSAEYMLILLLVVTLVMQMRGKLVSIMKKLLEALDKDVMEVANDDPEL